MKSISDLYGNPLTIKSISSISNLNTKVKCDKIITFVFHIYSNARAQKYIERIFPFIGYTQRINYHLWTEQLVNTYFHTQW
uniref:Uncharacterized protein n=1 Tax=Anguilla anguilla TaxID=7936 RepID=A0A0E9X2D8_ANGAN